jgi:beta-phosphoglucomutase-like phosphatase (HAD superfamily)
VARKCLQPIEAILLEPVGCLAEFPPEPFQEIAARLFQKRKQPSTSGSRSYWHLLNLMESRSAEPIESQQLETLELEAVESAEMYDDVNPALAEVKGMGVRLFLTSSLSAAAVSRFVTKFELKHFESVWSRENSGGIKAAPLICAIAAGSLNPRGTVFLTDTLEGLKIAARAEVSPVLMMNDPDEARRLALHNSSGGPAGGIVSFHELPDFVRLVSANARYRTNS